MNFNVALHSDDVNGRPLRYLVEAEDPNHAAIRLLTYFPPKEVDKLVAVVVRPGESDSQEDLLVEKLEEMGCPDNADDIHAWLQEIGSDVINQVQEQIQKHITDRTVVYRGSAFDQLLSDVGENHGKLVDCSVTIRTNTVTRLRSYGVDHADAAHRARIGNAGQNVRGVGFVEQAHHVQIDVVDGAGNTSEFSLEQLQEYPCNDPAVDTQEYMAKGYVAANPIERAANIMQMADLQKAVGAKGRHGAAAGARLEDLVKGR